MPQAKHTDSATGPWTNMSSAYCSQMDSALRAADPMLRALSQAQLGWMQLVMQRGRAWASLPAEFSRCKSPVDVASLQMRFLQTMGFNYAEGTQRVVHAMTTLSLPRGSEFANVAERDIIEVRSETGAGEPRNRDRQAA